MIGAGYLASRLRGSPPRARLLSLVVLFAAAAGVRAWILLEPGLGFASDLEYFTRWMRGLGAEGLAGFYASETFCDYPPFMILCFRALGAVIEALVRAPVDHTYHVAIKTLACFADLTIGVVLFRECRHLLGFGAGLLAAGLFLFNPVSIYDSAYWGQVDAVYTAFLLGAVVLVRRERWMGAGAACALGLAAKFQSVAVLPLVLFEAFRMAGARGLARACAGGAIAASVIATPFLSTGTLSEVTQRAYVDVIGQYHKMSNNAYNLWYLVTEPDMPDTAPPGALVELAAGGRAAVDRDASPLLAVTWRHISLVLFALGVAVVLAVYARRPGPISRYGAAGLLALCFFLFPTEIHERYAFPAVALLVPWAAAHVVHERLYWLFTIALLSNFMVVLSAEPLAPVIAGAMLLLFGAILVTTALARSVPPARHAAVAAPPRALPAPLRLFQRATVLACAVAALVACAVPLIARTIPEPALDGRARWLSSLAPELVQQGWGRLRRDRSVSGAPLELDGRIYLKGLGTHAPATLIYAVPADAERFEALVGIGGTVAIGHGSVRVSIELDGEPVHRSPILTAGSGVDSIRIDVSGRERLTLRVDPTPDGRGFDNVDLALARFVVGAPAAPTGHAP